MSAPEELHAVLGDKPAERFVQDHDVPVIPLETGQRKDNVTDEQLPNSIPLEEVCTLASPQEKDLVFRAEQFLINRR